MWSLLRNKEFCKAIAFFTLIAGICSAFIVSQYVRQDYGSYADIKNDSTSYVGYVFEEETTTIDEVVAYMQFVIEQHEVQQNTLESACETISDSFSTEVEECTTEVVKTTTRAEYKGYIITYYCGCEKCCGKWAEYHLTSSGTTPAEGRTLAADISVLPYGTRVEINGHEYVVEDTGSSIVGNRIDIYLESHEEALKRGVDYDVTVYVIGGEENGI